MLKEATFALTTAIAAAGSGCAIQGTIPKIHLSPTLEFHGQEANTEQPNKPFQICKGTHEQMVKCMLADPASGAGNLFQHIAKIPKLQQGAMPDEWDGVKPSSYYESMLEDGKITLTPDGRIETVRIDNIPYIFFKPVDPRFFERVMEHHSKFKKNIIENGMNMNDIEHVTIHTPYLYEFERRGKKTSFWTDFMEGSGITTLAREENGKKILKPRIFNGHFQDSMSFEYRSDGSIAIKAEYLGYRKNVIYVSPVFETMYTKGQEEIERREDKYILPDGGGTWRIEWRERGDSWELTTGSYRVHPPEAEKDFLQQFEFVNGEISSISILHGDIITRSDTTIKNTDFERGKPCSQFTTLDGYGRPEIIAKDGTILRSYTAEKKENPKLTPDQYLARLAEKLPKPSDSPCSWDALRKMVRIYPYSFSTNGESESWWQGWPEGLQQRDYVRSGFDIAILVQDILKRKGIRSHIVNIPDDRYGSMAVWLTVNENTTFDINYFGWAGLGKNLTYYTHETAGEFAKIPSYRDIPQAILSAKATIEEIYNIDFGERGIGTKEIETYLQLWDFWWGGTIPTLTPQLQGGKIRRIQTPYTEFINPR